MHKFKEIISPELVRKRISELGAEIAQAYAGQEILMVGVLSGAFLFLADLARSADMDISFDFVRLASYGKGTSRGGLELISDVRADICGRNVLIVEDIVDTGHSLRFLLDLFAKRNPASLAVCALVDKHERREVEVRVDFTGFRLDKGFVVGFGMDFAGKYRQLSGLYELIN